MTLKISGLSVRYGRTTVIPGLDLEAQPGEVTVILGPNGSGKSTVIRAVCSELPFRGSVALGGLDVAQTASSKLAALRAVLAQSTQVAFDFTVEEVVRLGLQSGIEAADTGLPLRALAEVGLEDRRTSRFNDLSGGQQARVHLARVRAQVWRPVVDDVPRWLSLDEPVAALDIAHQLQVMRVMRRFADAGGGVVAVMHDLNLSAMIADKLVLMHQGQVLAEGAPDAVLTDANLSAAYGCTIRVGHAPASGTPWLVPQAASPAH